MTDETQVDAEPAQLPVAPSLVRQAALDELTRLTALVSGLSVEQWSQPSAAAGWSNGDVVTHVNLALGLYSRLLDAALAGKGSGRAWKAFGDLTKKIGPSASPAFNKVNSAIPRMLGGALSPEVLKGQFAASARKFQQKVEQVGSEDYTRPIHYMGRPWPLSFFLAAVVNELAIHGWDVASRLETEAHLSAGARSVLPSFYWGGTSFMFRPPSGFRGTVQATLADPAFTLWWATDTGGTRQGTGEVKADVTISGESGTFVLVLAGRITPEDAMRMTSITASGEETLAKTFLSSWKIV